MQRSRGMSVVEELEAAGEVLTPVVRGVILALEATALRVESLEREVAELRARLGMNSRNSSKPPSSDPPGTPRRSAAPTGRPPGGQKGHRGAHRDRLPADEQVPHRPSRCGSCGHDLSDLPEVGEPVCLQVVDLPERALRVTEHRLACVRCSRCGVRTRARAPEGVQGHAFGARLSALVSLLVGQCHLSRRLTQNVLAQLGREAAPSLGSVEALLQESRHALSAPHREIRREVQASRCVGVDESTWRTKRSRAWAWLATTRGATLFQISRSRGGRNLPHLLGRSYPGVVTSDRWSAYNRYPPERRQLCWAHLARNFTALEERARDPEAARLGRGGVAITIRLFHHWHRFQAGLLSREELHERLTPARRRMGALIPYLLASEDRRARGLGRDLAAREEALWTFTHTEGVEPTNNQAERALRKLVLWRKTSFGSDSAGGVRFVERILSVIETCRQQRKNAFDFLRDAILASRCSTLPPSLFA